MRKNESRRFKKFFSYLKNRNRNRKLYNQTQSSTFLLDIYKIIIIKRERLTPLSDPCSEPFAISLRTFSSQFPKENHEPQKQSSPDISLFPSSRRRNVSAKIRTREVSFLCPTEWRPQRKKHREYPRSQSETWKEPHQRSICKSGATIGYPIACWHFTIDCPVIVISSDVSSYRGPRHIYRLTNRLVKAR